MVPIIVIVLSLILVQGQPVDDCCSKKTVGSYDYSLVEDYNGEPDPTCLNGCIYSRDGYPGSLYCFARGNQPVECKDGGPGIGGPGPVLVCFAEPDPNTMACNVTASTCGLGGEIAVTGPYPNCSCNCVLPPDTCFALPSFPPPSTSCQVIRSNCTSLTIFPDPGTLPKCDCECVETPEDIQTPWPGYCNVKPAGIGGFCEVYDRCQSGYFPVYNRPTCNSCTCEPEADPSIETCAAKPNTTTETCDVTWNFCKSPFIPFAIYPECSCDCIIPDENAVLWPFCSAQPIVFPPFCNITVNHCFGLQPHAYPPNCPCQCF